MSKFNHTEIEDGRCYVDYYCPGCKCGHGYLPVTIGLDPAKKIASHWQWNGDIDNPTLSPSVNVEPQEPKYQCHHHVRNGKIEFLQDCYHALAGQTVDLPDASD